MNGLMRLRAPEPADVDMLYLWENDPEVWCHGITSAPLSRHQIWEYVHNYDADPLRSGQLRLIMEHTGDDYAKVPVGCIDLYDIDARHRHAWVGIITAPAYRREGFAGQALELLKSYCRDTLGLHSIGAVVAVHNAPSLRLFAKHGFTQCGKLKGWFRCGKETYADAVLLQCLL